MPLIVESMNSRALSLVIHLSASNHSRCDIAVPSGATVSLPLRMQNMRRPRWKSTSPLWVLSSSIVTEPAASRFPPVLRQNSVRSQVVDQSALIRGESRPMIALLLHLLRLLPFLCGGHRQLALENLALRQQLAVYKRTTNRPRLRRYDRGTCGPIGRACPLREDEITFERANAVFVS